MDKREALKRYFGHLDFRMGQEALVDALTQGKDALGVMPTGAGKSMCYQIPALLLPGVTLVISPLISLMKDQVAALSQAGVSAAFLNSSLTAAQQRNALARAKAGEYKLLYVAPERLFSTDFLSFVENAVIPLVAVDEAHCVSQWGQDFRPDYLKIADFIACLKTRPVLGAFTATATRQVREDIVRLLNMRAPLTVTTGFDRPNLYFSVEKPKKKQDFVVSYALSHRADSGIVYCATRANVEAVCDALQKSGVQATRYHAGLSDAERRQNQEDFVFDRARVMVATNAFGMGIDKSNVRYVLHYNMPKNMESYYQEAGRAGRDGERAECVLLYSPGDIMTAKFLIGLGDANTALSLSEREQVRQMDLERLEKMIAYCKTDGCLRQNILRYFGEKNALPCGNCGNCAAEYTLVDETLNAQKVLSCVARIDKKYPYGLGAALIIDVLRGSEGQRILKLALNTLPTYGLLKGMDRTRLAALVDYLTSEGYLLKSSGEYPVLHLGDKARAVLFEGAKVAYPMRHTAAEKLAPSAGKASQSAPDDALFSALKELRIQLARKEHVPAYVIFSDATLRDMAAKRPKNHEEFLLVSGVGEIKAKRYEEAFLAITKNPL